MKRLAKVDRLVARGLAATPRLIVAGAITISLALAALPASAQGGRVRVYGVGVPSAVTSSWGTRNTVLFNVSVRNDSSEAVSYRLRVEFQGVATSTASPLGTVNAGAVARIPMSVDVDLRANPSGGDRLPYTVVLLNAGLSQILDRFTGSLRVRPVVPSLTPDLSAPPRPPVYARDIAVQRITYVPPSTLIGAREGREFAVLVKNRGRERWAYAGTIGADIGTGTPETHIERSDRLTLMSTPLPRGLAPGDSAVVWLRVSPITARGPVGGTVTLRPDLPTELWVTVRVYVASSYDVNSSNDALYYILRMNADHQVAESRTLPAPPLTVQVIPR